MDPFSDILRLLSARSYATAGLAVGDHWCRQYPGFDGFKFIFIQTGHFWFRFTQDEPWLSLGAGEGVVLTRCRPFIMATDKQQPVVVVTKDTPPESESVSQSLSNLLIAGKMEIDALSAELLLSIMPAVLPFSGLNPASNKISWLMNELYHEKKNMPAGHSLACDHLMHLAIIEVFRDWLQNNVSPKGIAAALVEPRILKVLHHMHNQPEKAWTLVELAAIANLSRAGFAKRFHEVMGNPPLRYLTEWRMRVASKMLRQGHDAIKNIAYQLGYKNESTFSAVFKRIYGHSPTEHRRLQSSTAAAAGEA